MLNSDLLSKIQDFTETASAKAGEYSSLIDQARAIIVKHFGENGLIAAYIALAALLIFIVSKLAKITFSTLRFLVIPAVALAFIGSFFVPYSFFALLPVTVTAGSVILLFKG
ncbi:MAG: hypothetical protein DRP35_09495 [Candidatus Zixiibacteriota bacterium]|nr:MAG: hypothetical protein DRP35_09495 [candidate division Zixibacteria bacterium]